MTTAIIYYSHHHGNTKKLIDAIAAAEEVDLIDASKDPGRDLSGYDLIGLASGIYAARYAPQLLSYAEKNLPEGSKVFFRHTAAMHLNSHFSSVRKLAENKHAEIVGEFSCIGYNTFGPFKLFGGSGKGHPDAEDLQKAVAFYRSLIR